MSILYGFVNLSVSFSSQGNEQLNQNIKKLLERPITTSQTQFDYSFAVERRVLEENTTRGKEEVAERQKTVLRKSYSNLLIPTPAKAADSPLSSSSSNSSHLSSKKSENPNKKLDFLEFEQGLAPLNPWDNPPTVKDDIEALSEVLGDAGMISKVPLNQTVAPSASASLQRLPSVNVSTNYKSASASNTPAMSPKEDQFSNVGSSASQPPMIPRRPDGSVGIRQSVSSSAISSQASGDGGYPEGKPPLPTRPGKPSPSLAAAATTSVPSLPPRLPPNPNSTSRSGNTPPIKNDTLSLYLAKGFEESRITFAIQAFGRNADSKLGKKLNKAGIKSELIADAVNLYDHHLPNTQKVEDFISAFIALKEFGFEELQIKEALVINDAKMDLALDYLTKKT